ncbi:MAG TPA: DNA-directed DNA polymerase [archaeon]|nr:DNA-directed DNA polymerase [archaeon]
MKENLLAIDLDYTLIENKPTVRIFCRSENGKNVLVLDSNFEPYFYAMPKEGKLTELKKKIGELDTKKLETKILKVETVEKIWNGEKTKLIKITIDNPRKIPEVRNEIKDCKEVEETYEYDIPFYKRYITDKQIEPMNWISVDGEEVKTENYQVDKTIKASSVRPVEKKKEAGFKVLAFDTEWVEEDGKAKLIMLSLVCNDGYKKVLTSHDWDKKPSYVESVKGEKEIIERFLEIVKETDANFICSYNGDNFDFPKLKEKASEFKISLKLGRDNAPVYIVRRGRISSAKTKGRIHIDIFDFVDHILSSSMKSEVLTLDEVAQELLGIGKKEMDYKEMVEIWSRKEQLGKLAEYCLQDSTLTMKLGELILPQIFALSRLTGLLPFDSSRNTYSQLVEAFLMRRAFTDNVLTPNRPKTEEMEKRRLEPSYKGAIVIQPEKGIHSNVLVFDFRSLYPTIIVTHNISPETFNYKPCKKKTEVPETDWYFCQDKKGFVSKHLEDIIEKRKKIKDEMKAAKEDSEEHRRLDNEQYALKIIANATYGMFGFFGAKWYGRECGSASAAFGRFYITKIIDLAKNDGFKIIYGDTDSLMVTSQKDLPAKELKKIGESFEGKVNKQLPGIIELEFRDLYEGGIFVARREGEVGAKKRYALIDYDGNLEVIGFETVRRDWCDLSKKVQREVLTVVLRDKNPAKAVQLVRDTIKKIKEGKVSLDELTIFEQITRPLSQYEQIGPHVRAAQKAKAKGRPVGEGMVIGFVIVKGKGTISDRAEPVEDVKPSQYDPEYYIEHQVLPASMRVLKALGYTEQEVLSGKIQKNLEGFLKK